MTPLPQLDTETLGGRAVPTDADMDDIHHALGRPDGPWVTPYRNRYCTSTSGDQARRFGALGLWRRDCLINSGSDALYSVTDEGKAVMWRWLAARGAAKGIRRYEVTAGGCEPHTVMAKSAGAAKHSLYLHLDDAGWVHSFADFVKLKPRVRLA